MFAANLWKQIWCQLGRSRSQDNNLLSLWERRQPGSHCLSAVRSPICPVQTSFKFFWLCATKTNKQSRTTLFSFPSTRLSPCPRGFRLLNSPHKDVVLQLVWINIVENKQKRIFSQEGHSSDLHTSQNKTRFQDRNIKLNIYGPSIKHLFSRRLKTNGPSLGGTFRDPQLWFKSNSKKRKKVSPTWREDVDRREQKEDQDSGVLHVDSELLWLLPQTPTEWPVEKASGLWRSDAYFGASFR